MRIVVHDYSGHAFPVQLSRSLAARGHQVLHLHSASFTTPQGPLKKRDDDPAGFQPEPIVLPEQVDKSNNFKRRKADIDHGNRVVERLKTFKPEVVLSGNTPLDAQRLILSHAQSQGGKFVFWVQDLIGQAVMRLIGKKGFGLGKLVGMHYVNMENSMLERSDKIVVISEDFRPHLPASVRNTPKVEVVENWALIDEIPLMPRENKWSIAQGFSEGLNFVYSGTLGMKHNPELLVQLASQLANKGRLIVISEGQSIEFLKQRMLELKLENMHLLPFQPFETMPQVLAASDVLVAILEPDAGVFSVPSKVLTYLCANKPLLMAMPQENLAARIVTENGAGIVVGPDDCLGFVQAAQQLVDHPETREKMGAAARSYAERTFNIDLITNKFEKILMF